MCANIIISHFSGRFETELYVPRLLFLPFLGVHFDREGAIRLPLCPIVSGLISSFFPGPNRAGSGTELCTPIGITREDKIANKRYILSDPSLSSRDSRISLKKTPPPVKILIF